MFRIRRREQFGALARAETENIRLGTLICLHREGWLAIAARRFSDSADLTSSSLGGITADERNANQLRPVNFELGIAPHASGSVLVSMGSTRVLCGVMIEESVPRWMKDQRVNGGWLTAEYSMLPYSTLTRKPRDISKGRLDGRSSEIQRLIGRSMRTVVDLEKSVRAPSGLIAMCSKPTAGHGRRRLLERAWLSRWLAELVERRKNQRVADQETRRSGQCRCD